MRSSHNDKVSEFAHADTVSPPLRLDVDGIKTETVFGDESVGAAVARGFGDGASLGPRAALAESEEEIDDEVGAESGVEPLAINSSGETSSSWMVSVMRRMLRLPIVNQASLPKVKIRPSGAVTNDRIPTPERD